MEGGGPGSFLETCRAGLARASFKLGRRRREGVKSLFVKLSLSSETGCIHPSSYGS
jgi:hypothetical protein